MIICESVLNYLFIQYVCVWVCARASCVACTVLTGVMRLVTNRLTPSLRLMCAQPFSSEVQLPYIREDLGSLLLYHFN